MKDILFLGDSRLDCCELPIQIKALLKDASLVSFNCETVIDIDGILDGKSIEKRYPIKTGKIAYKFISFLDNNYIANVANNHSGDYGRLGFEVTRKFLRKNIVGGRYTSFRIVRIGELKIACICATDYGDRKYLNITDTKKIERIITKVKKYVDRIIIQVHYGFEYVSLPHIDDIERFHNFIDKGADLIVGHHPHVVLPIEKYKNGFIAYSLGNFQFGTETRHTNDDYGMIVRYNPIDNNVKHQIVFIDDRHIPHVISNKEEEFVRGIIEKRGEVIRKIDWLYHLKWYRMASKIYLSSNFSSWIYRINKYGIKHFWLFLKNCLSKQYIKMYLGLFLGGLFYVEKSYGEMIKKNIKGRKN